SRLECQHREQGTLARAPHWNRPTGVDDLEGTEYPNLHLRNRTCRPTTLLPVFDRLSTLARQGGGRASTTGGDTCPCTWTSITSCRKEPLRPTLPTPTRPIWPSRIATA